MEEVASPTEKQDSQTFEENLEKFQVVSQLEIGGILRGIQNRKQLIRMALPSTSETILTSVLDVEVTERKFTIDCPPFDRHKSLISASSLISFEGILDRIKISFATRGAERTRIAGEPALRLDFPERLIRLQRRDHFRIPITNTIIRIPMGEDVLSYSLASVRDLSPNGACVVDASMSVDATVGKIYRNCRLELPETQPFMVSLEIRNSRRIAMQNNTYQRRLGCQFYQLSSAQSALIQRYINRLERQHRIVEDPF